MTDMTQFTHSDNNSELFPIVDEQGNVIGSASRGECHGGGKLLHPVVHLHVYDNEGRLYLQKRPVWKDIQPGRWDTAVGGHVDFGENPEDALRREAREEIGLVGFIPQWVARYVFESDREKEFVHVWRTSVEGVLSPSDELDGGRFWPEDEILDSLGKGIFTPNFENEYRSLLLKKDIGQ